MLCIFLCTVFSIMQITEPTPRGSTILPNYNDNRNFVLFSQGTSKQELNGSLHKLLCIYLKESLHITSNKQFRLPLSLVYDRIYFFLLSYAYSFWTKKTKGGRNSQNYILGFKNNRLATTDLLGCCTHVFFVVELKPCRMEMAALLCVGSKDRSLLQGLSVHSSVSMGKHERY